MLLFVVGHFFERRPRRRGYARDEMPLRPLVDVLLFWVLFVSGCFFAALAGAAAMIRGILDVRLEQNVIVIAFAMGLLAPFCLRRSFRYLWKLTRTSAV
jgi:hypothetical protein